jgi:hypothetical protein
VRAHVSDWLQEFELVRLESTLTSAPVVSATQLAEIGFVFCDLSFVVISFLNIIIVSVGISAHVLVIHNALIMAVVTR